MTQKNLFIIVFIWFCISGISAQSIPFADDANERGYYDRDYLRYEAEQEKCATDGVILEPTYDQRNIQSEASGQSAVNLTAKGS